MRTLDPREPSDKVAEAQLRLNRATYNLHQLQARLTDALREEAEARYALAVAMENEKNAR